jgi:hypothetical protein
MKICLMTKPFTGRLRVQLSIQASHLNTKMKPDAAKPKQDVFLIVKNNNTHYQYRYNHSFTFSIILHLGHH